jgi:hypothetical protein
MSSLDPVLRYFAAANDGRIDDACACFSSDAQVRDENSDHHGIDAIRAWIEETTRNYQPQVEILRSVVNGDQVTVTGCVSGNFPGSPIELDFSFTNVNESISRLSVE